MTQAFPWPDLLDTLAARANAVLIAPPGAGKTTLVPPALLDAPWRDGGRIVVLEPRRLAARAAASRMAFLAGEMVGQRFGFRTRFESAISAATEVEVLTEGLLVRRLQSDPGLDGVACVIFDEIHERSLDCDIALAFCLDLQRALRPELRLVAMSATAEGARLSALLDAKVIETAANAHPLSVRHAARDIASPRDLPEALARAVRAALAEEAGDVLAFLPGMAEIRRAQSALDGCGALVLPLHGELPPAEQDRALRPAEGRRVVLATSIAETSLTVPGVRIVIDGGWRRTPRLDPSTGLSRLATLRISRAAADQRAGRAAREGPGVAIRLWTPALHRGLAAHDRPEIMEAELSGLALDCAAWGAAPDALPFPDQPPEGAMKAAVALLGELGALDGAGRITEAGRAMARIGSHPRLAAMMLAARDAGEAALAARIAALVEERDPLRAPDAPAGVGLRLEALAGDVGGADRAALSRIGRAASIYARRLGTRAEPAGDPGRLIAAGFPDRIAQRRGEVGSFRLAGGGGASLPRTDKLAEAKLLAVASIDLGRAGGARIKLAAPLEAAALPEAVAARVIEATESGFDPVSGSVLSRRRRRLGALVLEDRTVPADPEQAAGTLAAAAWRHGALVWSEAARQFQARAAWLRGVDETFPDLADAALAADPVAWLAPYLTGMTRLEAVRGLDLLPVLRGMLSHEQAARLDRELPTHLALPGGRAAVDYTEPVPLAAARAQAFYGLHESPRLAGGRVRLRLALLSPAGRPVAITEDLAGFWGGAWADARKDMRGRYPKHDWPERP